MPKFKNDEVGASAYDPRVMLKVVLLACSHGLISSRAIERACARTSNGVIQGYAAQAAVDSANQIIVAADMSGSGSEQSMLLPMIEQTAAYREADTPITADAGYHSDANVAQLMTQATPAPIADNSVKGRQLYSQRIGTVEPVLGNTRHNKRLTRLNLRGREKVNAQWHLFCIVHNIEKLAHSGWMQ